MKTVLKQFFPKSWWDKLRRTKEWIVSKYLTRFARAILTTFKDEDMQHTLEDLGYTLARRTDYYSPLPSIADLRSTQTRWNKPSALNDIVFDLDEMKRRLSDLLGRYYEEFATYPPYQQLSQIGFGPGYTAVDALTLYLMIRNLKPARYLEIGSGLSTYYASLAAVRNGKEGSPVAMTCIEPHPYEKLATIPGIVIVKDQVENVEPSLFRSLAPNDILFIDSSHVLRVGGDVAYLLLEILPTLPSGVAIHVHDVPFPFNIPYPPELWIFGQKWPMFWNEAMVLQALLCGNRDFEIVLSTPLIRYFDEQFLRDKIPIHQSVQENQNTFSSIWLKKR